MKKKVAMILSGCGFLDGSEIQEAVLTLLALDQAGADVQCCALDKPQADVVDHLEKKAAAESRNVLRESARIARGNIMRIGDIHAKDFDALMMPGGFGAAKNLCNYASAGTAMTVDPEIARLVKEFHVAGKPIGSLCIAPVVLASVFSGLEPLVELTIGNDSATAENIREMGGKNIDCPVTECHIDTRNKIVTAPAYMYGDKGPADVYAGIRKAVDAVLDLA